jgi:hypothetical protein
MISERSTYFMGATVEAKSNSHGAESRLEEKAGLITAFLRHYVVCSQFMRESKPEHLEEGIPGQV